MGGEKNLGGKEQGSTKLKRHNPEKTVRTRNTNYSLKIETIRAELTPCQVGA